ncbi:ATP-binding protein [Halobacillus yeomjeoni]|uniref:AAA family ATPase n=1 Tax=Halobacillus yeomjeoni TaxID=311194 RepID=A0A931HRM7_9BACI|nr:AAA family ATPase [Halobacillus yeomjeoni]MBH0228700.1 AAA family ATPase [Halobacillus yeomjeoni]
MKIIEMNIYGFGKWKDHTIHVEEENINVITGENEAGKSTLRQFILYILFGLPSKKRDLYLPKSGGSLGGRLIVSTSEYGRLIIERIDNRNNGKAVCQSENGEVMDEGWLSHLLKGTSREVYQSIFSFSAEDLMEIQQLSGHHLGEALMSIGITGSDRIYETENWLEKQINDRFKPKGKNPKINQRLNEVEKTNRDKNTAEKNEYNYQTLLDSKEGCIAEINQMEDKLKESQRLWFSHEQLLKSISVISEYHQAKGKLGEVESTSDFPPEGRERYQNLKDRLLPLESEKHQLTMNKAEIEQELSGFESHKPDEELLNQAQSLLDRKDSFDKVKHTLEQLEARAQDISHQLDQDIKKMSIPIDEEELQEYPFPFYIEETWRELREEKKETEQEEQRLIEQESEADNEIMKLEERLDTAQKEMISDSELRTYTDQIDHAYEMAASGRPQNALELKQQRNQWLVFTVVLIGTGWGMAWFSSNPSLGYLATLIGVGAAYWAFQKHRKIKGLSDVQKQNVSQVPAEKSLEDARRMVQKYENEKSHLNHLKDQRKYWRQEEIRLEEKRRNLSQRRRRLEARLEEQVSHYPFLASLPVRHWTELYHLLIQAQQRNEEYLHLKAEIKDYEFKMHQIEDELNQFCQHFGRGKTDESADECWKQLIEWWTEQNNKSEQMERLSLQLKNHEEKLNDVLLQIHPYEEKQKQLFAMAGVDSEEEFYRKLQSYEDYQQTLEMSKRLQQQVRSLLSKDEQEFFSVWEKVPDESAVRMESASLQEEIDKTEKRLREYQQRLSDTKTVIDQLEKSEQHSELIHRYEMEKSMLKEEAKEWAKYQVAREILKKTKEQYKRLYLPKVIEKAEYNFKKLTLDRYQRIHFSGENAGVSVEDERGRIFYTEELSRGTKDQLYVSFRFALGETVADQMNLPFIIDDAFVHFDGFRLKEMYELIGELSRHHQIILFSFRNELVDEFSGAHAILLSR